MRYAFLRFVLVLVTCSIALAGFQTRAQALQGQPLTADQQTARALSGLLLDDVDDVRAHGKDERIAAWAFFDGVEFMYRLVKTLSI